ncbi:MAG TPA: transporter [Candidatus Binataceae bacterium]|nr:transporter [Candidatus Binataceae bacterium]
MPCVCLITLLWYGLSSASEYGQGSYRPGFTDLLAGAMPMPGTTGVKTFFMYQDENIDASNREISLHANTAIYSEDILGLHVTNLKMFGANYGFGVLAQSHILNQSIGIGPRGFSMPHKTETFGGLGDTIFLPAMLNWNLGDFHLLSSVAVYTPTGAYSKDRIANTGLNRWAIEPDFGFTWLDPDTGREASMFTGYTVNSPNTATDYRSGDEFHNDFVLAQHLPHGITTGVSGYAVQQTTPDTGNGAIFGGYRGRVLGLGPLVDKGFDIDGHHVEFDCKYDFEFAAQHRATGNELWFNTTIPL